MMHTSFSDWVIKSISDSSRQCIKVSIGVECYVYAGTLLIYQTFKSLPVSKCTLLMKSLLICTFAVIQSKYNYILKPLYKAN